MLDRTLFHVLRQQNISLVCYRPTVQLKGVTHYTLQGKAREKEYEQTVRTPFVVGAIHESPVFVLCGFDRAIRESPLRD